MPEATPQPKKDFPVLPIVIIVLVFGAALLAVRNFILPSIIENRAEQVFEAETGGKAEINLDGKGRFEFETDNGKIIIDQQGTLPKDFPEDIAIYTGAEVTAFVSMDSDEVKGFNATISTRDSKDEVYDFYLDALEDNGWEIVSKLTSDAYNVIGAEKNTRTLVVTITTDNGETLAVITVKTE